MPLLLPPLHRNVKTSRRPTLRMPADAATLNALLRSFNGPQLVAVSDVLEREGRGERAALRR